VMNAGMLLVGIVWVVIAAFQGPMNIPGDALSANVASLAAPAAVAHGNRVTSVPASAAQGVPGKIS